MQREKLEATCINTLRMLAVDMVEKAASGHPGMPMGAAPMAFVLWDKFLRHNPKDPAWPDRDRFVLSAGHGSALLYSLLHLTGYDLSVEDLKAFRQWESRTPGHPERGVTPGVEVTTGPLGQGFANGVGIAVAERRLAAMFNMPGFDIVDHYTYAIVSDGDLMEGIASEAASLAGHLKLGRLIYLYDNNHITLSAEARVSFTEDVGMRFAAYGWHVLAVPDGNDTVAIEAAIKAAREETGRPSLIIVSTHIGYGSPHRQDTFEAHGSPLGHEETSATKENLGWPVTPDFYVPDEAFSHFRGAVLRGADLQSCWDAMMRSYGEKYPELYRRWQVCMDKRLPEGWDADIPKYGPGHKDIATRSAGGTVLNTVAKRVDNIIGGSGDLDPSTKTYLSGKGGFQGPGTGDGGYAGSNVSFGVREHAMGGILNGVAAHGGLIPFGSTFLIFSDYMRPSMRLAALSRLPVKYVFTHDSAALGEDGPTHQPVEHLSNLRAMPGMTVIRPADANETAEAWKAALARDDGPVALVLSRQDLPVIDRVRYAPASGVMKGAYILAGPADGRPDVIIIATGSEVHPALAAYEALDAGGVTARLVSMPSWELFEEQPEEYRYFVLPPEVSARVSVEAAASHGWHKYVGTGGAIIGLDRFGASAPGEVNMERFGFTAGHIVAKVKELLAGG